MNGSPNGARDRVILIGAGRVGVAVAHLLVEQAFAVVGVSSRSPESAETAAARLNASVFEYREGLPAAEVILIATPDDAIEGVAEAIAPHLGPDRLVCHFAGSLGTAPLRAAADSGALVAALHPVQACPTVEAGIERLPGSAWGVTAAGVAAERAVAMVRAIDGVVVAVEESDRALWHAAAVVTSNGLAALSCLGVDVLRAIGVDGPEQVLTPLLRGTLANVLGAERAVDGLTGPLVRGDISAIERHVAALTDRAPALLESYSLAVRTITSEAARLGRLGTDEQKRVTAALERS